MKSMKKKGGMKKAKKSTMKRRKAMKVSKIAKGKRAKSSVFRGTKIKTSGGLVKTDLIKSKTGKIVSKKSERSWQTHIQEKWIGQVDCRMSKGAKRFETQRIRCYWWQIGARKGSVGQGSLVLQKGVNEIWQSRRSPTDNCNRQMGFV